MPWTVPFTRCTSSPEPAEASSPTASPESSPSAPSSSRTTPAESSPCAGPEWPSGTTCAPSAPTTPTAPEHFRGSAQTPESSSSPAASPARTFPPPERERASPRANARASGASLPASFARYDPPTHSWRIPQCLFQGDLSLYSATWPRSGILLDGTCYPLPPWAPATNANESGLPAPAPPKFPTVTINGNDNFKGASDTSGDGLHTFIRKMEGTWGDRGGNGPRPTPATGRTPAPRRETGIAPILEPPSTHTATRVPEVPLPAEPGLPLRPDHPARMGEEPEPSPAQPQRLRAYPTPRVHDWKPACESETKRHSPSLATFVLLDEQ